MRCDEFLNTKPITVRIPLRVLPACLINLESALSENDTVCFTLYQDRTKKPVEPPKIIDPRIRINHDSDFLTFGKAINIFNTK